MGKSTAARLLSDRGVRVIDTDEVAREVVRPGTAGLESVRAAFGEGVLAADGTLDRAALGRLVFADPAARARLEGILHPAIRAAWEAQLVRWSGEGVSIGAVVIPLLFETGAQDRFDAVACVACLPASQRARLAARGWTAEESERRLAAQWPLARKIEGSRYVVWTEVPMEVYAAQWERVLALAAARSGRAGEGVSVPGDVRR